jgi:hypothetical protein
MWTTVAKVAFSVLITAIQKIPASEWAKLGVIIVSWLQAVQDKLPAGHPWITSMHAYRAPLSKLAPPKTGDPWGS